MSRVAMMGSGSWGTVFSMVMADAGSDVVIWSRDQSVVTQINEQHVNIDYHPDLVLPDTVWATTDAQDALTGADIVVVALPAQVLRANLTQWRAFIPEDAILVSLIKGVELGTMKRLSEVIA